MLGEKRQDLSDTTAHHLTDGNLLASILGLKHREAEDANERNKDADEGEEFDLTDKTELLLIGLFKIVIQEIERVLFIRTDLVHHLSCLSFCGKFIISSLHANKDLPAKITP